MPSTFRQPNNLSCQRHHRTKKEVEGNQEAAEVCKTYFTIVLTSVLGKAIISKFANNNMLFISGFDYSEETTSDPSGDISGI